ncbi:hypothetical protein RRG08_030230 [Elysia crispata]|uniref:Uncharacterized protein n=1 Tax=Elysia crispata TaxID=231223 RepID=A0AAE1AIN6_9GAST|nr:hypothetical protein RRG08_030230 [Elysia crispata]
MPAPASPNPLPLRPQAAAAASSPPTNPAEERLSSNPHLIDYVGLDRQDVYCSLRKIIKKNIYYCSS